MEPPTAMPSSNQLTISQQLQPSQIPPGNSNSIKRFKPIETCDNCKDRKVKCDKERPVCGTCKRTKRECTYNFSASSKRGRPKSELEIIQEQIEEITYVQYNQLDQLESMLEHLGQGTSSSQNGISDFGGGVPTNSANNPYEQNSWPGTYSVEPVAAQSLNQNLIEETLQVSAMIAAKLPPKSNGAPLIVTPPDPIPYPDFDMHPQNPIDQITNDLNNLNLMESTRYVGEGSLLMLSDNAEELIVPQAPTDLTQVEDDLKILPDPSTAKYLINLYYERVYRHFPHVKRKVIDGCLNELTKPQHFLLLNCIFFAASPFHKDPEKTDGSTYHKRAVVLLQHHCLQTPHVLTVISLFILGLHTRTMGSAWIFHGMASKMTFELGLHRKIKNIPLSSDVKEMRDMAFWGCFVAETWVSACYGRPSAIDEATCDVDLLPIPTDPEPDEETRLHIAWILHINLLRIFAQVRKYLFGRAKIEGTRREENQFKFLDAALGRWFCTLPQWLKFEEMAKDVQGSLLGAIGGEMHTLFWTVLILLHSLNLAMFTSNPVKPTLSPVQEQSRISSQTICVHAATILLHWLDVLMNSVPDFFEQSCTSLFAIAPAIRVLAWTAQRGNQKAEGMVERLKEIKNEVKRIAARRFISGRLDGEETLKGWHGKFKEEEKKNVPDQDEHMPSPSRRKGNRRPNNRAMSLNEDTDNFKFTFESANFNNFPQAQIPFSNYTQPILNQQLQATQPSSNSNYSEMLFSSTLSPPHTSSASTSPYQGSIPSFQSPIFNSGNAHIQQQTQQQLHVQNPAVNMWATSPYNTGYDAKIVIENGNNFVGGEEYVSH